MEFSVKAKTRIQHMILQKAYETDPGDEVVSLSDLWDLLDQYQSQQSEANKSEWSKDEVEKLFPAIGDADRWFDRINKEGKGESLAKHYFMQGIEFAKNAIYESIENR